jgi:hypothetical protein
MNKKIYKSFEQEICLEKYSDIYHVISKGVSKTLKTAWHHPKATLGILASAAIGGKLIHDLFPPVVVGNQFVQSHIMENQNNTMKKILQEEQLRNYQPKPSIPLQKKIEHPLV